VLKIVLIINFLPLMHFKSIQAHSLSSNGKSRPKSSLMLPTLALSTSVKSCNVVLNNKERINNSSSVTTTTTCPRETYLSAETTEIINLLSLPKSPSVLMASNGGGFCYGIASPTTIDSRTCEERNLTFAVFRFPKKSRENCFPVSREN
jgi:hypothetical protein